MSFTNTNDYIAGRKPVPTPMDQSVVAVRFAVDLATGDLALNTIGQVGILPAGYVPVDAIIDGTDMDSGAAAAVFQLGIWDGSGASLSTAAADGGGAWGDTGAAVATAFSKNLSKTLNNIATVQPATTDRKVGVKVTTAPTTAVAGTVGVTLLYRAA